MTTAFTYAQTNRPDMHDTIGSPSRALPFRTDEAPAVSKENTDPHCTPPSSPTKQPRPSTPKSTPLHRRFLKEVSMSPASPGTPATPPRTPSRNQRDTLTQGRDSPIKVRPIPTKHRVSPAKLEIGQNGFYFSCEIPMSKITPKKQASPQKSSRAGTPTRRTPSPLKNETPVKRNPAKALFGTPTGKANECAKSRAGTPVMKSIAGDIPAWTSSKVHPAEALDLTSEPSAPLRIPPDCLLDIGKQVVQRTDIEAPATAFHQALSRPSSAHSAKDSRSENIGHMMARLTSGTFKTHDWAHTHQTIDPIKSPAPTPLRMASQKFYSVAPPATLKWNVEERTVVIDEPTKNTGKMSSLQTQEPYPLGSKYFDESKRVKSPASKSGVMASPKVNPAGPKVRTKKVSPLQGDTTLDDMAQVPPSPYTELLFPGPGTGLDPEATNNSSSHRSEKHLQWRGPIFSPTQSKYRRTNQHRRAGTDPEVYLAMQKDMASMGESLRRSIGSVLSFSRPNTNELPIMSNTIFMQELEAEKPKITTELKARGRLTRWNTDTPAVCPARPDTLLREKPRAATLTAPGIPMWQQSRGTPRVRVKTNSTKDVSEVAASPAKAAVVTPRSRPVKTALGKLSKAPAIPATTPRRQLRTAELATTPARPPFKSPARKQTPAASPAKDRRRPPATPPGVSKLKVLHTPAPRTKPLPKTPMSTRKPVPNTPQLAMIYNQTKPQALASYDPSTDPRPYEEKFASAADIAKRVTKWHSEDREKATTALRQGNLPTKTPSKTPNKATKKAMGVKDVATTTTTTTTEESTTPVGSPTKLPIRIASPSKLALRITANTPSALTPPTRPQPVTPHNPKLKLQPFKTNTATKPNAKTETKTNTKPATKPKPNPPTKPFNPRTPIRTNATPSRIAVIDRNAFRTPSKAIQNSLDRAIDEKIREDKRAGREFVGRF